MSTLLGLIERLSGFLASVEATAIIPSEKGADGMSYSALMKAHDAHDSKLPKKAKLINAEMH